MWGACTQTYPKYFSTLTVAVPMLGRRGGPASTSDWLLQPTRVSGPSGDVVLLTGNWLLGLVGSALPQCYLQAPAARALCTYLLGTYLVYIDAGPRASMPGLLFSKVQQVFQCCDMRETMTEEIALNSTWFFSEEGCSAYVNWSYRSALPSTCLHLRLAIHSTLIEFKSPCRSSSPNISRPKDQQSPLHILPPRIPPTAPKKQTQRTCKGPCGLC